MKKIRLILIGALLCLMLPLSANASGIKNIYIFKGKTCGYCAKALEFFTNLKKDSEYKDKFNLVEYEIWYNDENKKLGEKVAESKNEELDGVPYIVIGDKTFSGYTSSYDSQIKSAIDTYYESDDEDIVAKFVDSEKLNVSAEYSTGVSEGNEKDSNADTVIAIIIIVVAVVGFGYVIYISRKDETPKAKITKEPKKIEEEENKKIAERKNNEKKTNGSKTTNQKKSNSNKNNTKKKK